MPAMITAVPSARRVRLRVFTGRSSYRGVTSPFTHGTTLGPPSAYGLPMIKLIVLYGTPTDPAAFDDYYKNTHIPIAAKIPGLRRMEVSNIGSLDGSTPQYHLQAELYFDDQNALMAALGTPEGAAAGADVANFASGGATMLVGEVIADR